MSPIMSPIQIITESRSLTLTVISLPNGVVMVQEMVSLMSHWA
jgi:hypothetical protein